MSARDVVLKFSFLCAFERGKRYPHLCSLGFFHFSGISEAVIFHLPGLLLAPGPLDLLTFYRFCLS
jgi:hypothetical protein